MASQYECLRAQIIANASMLLTKLNEPETKLSNEGKNKNKDIDVIVFGQSGAYMGAVMYGITPAIESAEATAPDLAMRKLLTATCELLNAFMPKLGAHQRNIHGGGVFDEDLISQELIEAAKKG